jgi:purine-nucleoside phosphorylase
LVAGQLDGCEVLAVDGRFHRYEGWSVPEIVFPVRVMAALGIRALIVSNAAGGIHSQFSIGDIMVIAGHIDLQFGAQRLRCISCQPKEMGEGILQRGPTPYDPEFGDSAFCTARREGFAAYHGVYLATLGPNYETRAEYRMMRKLGADVVGMSTVPEVLEAQRLGIRVLAMSMISNLARPDTPAKASHEEVLAAGSIAEPKMTSIARDIARSFVSPNRGQARST